MWTRIKSCISRRRSSDDIDMVDLTPMEEPNPCVDIHQSRPHRLSSVWTTDRRYIRRLSTSAQDECQCSGQSCHQCDVTDVTIKRD
ncbi:hypothetical protein DPMN_146477 [Dreissena polymorpha]|uniref:Uncharacterized protein n=1 Tax=Dreissena polymorpha TaxID=45954 RepID=A0A9D4FAE0_DREPO|nr:hypothetical protein DPMN_146477 [Dreissena polymorpha]